MIVKSLPPFSSAGSQDEWQVWIQMVDGDPLKQNESFIIGLGLTFAEAKATALVALRDAIAVTAALTDGTT